MQLLCARERARLREVEGGFDLGLDLAIDLSTRRRVQLLAECLDRVAGFPACSLFALAETEREILAGAHML